MMIKFVWMENEVDLYHLRPAQLFHIRLAITFSTCQLFYALPVYVPQRGLFGIVNMLD